MERKNKLGERRVQKLGGGGGGGRYVVGSSREKIKGHKGSCGGNMRKKILKT